MINRKLKDYIEKEIIPRNNLNDFGHSEEHVNYVINKSLAFASTVENINLDMVLTIAAYHDIGHNINPDEHEKISAKILLEDNYLHLFFTIEEIFIMYDAIMDHRASCLKEPRSIYGKIVSSADRNVSVEEFLIRTYEYILKNRPGLELESIIQEAFVHLTDKFGLVGYGRQKMYFYDADYEKFLQQISNLSKDYALFKETFLEVVGKIRIRKQKRVQDPFIQQ